MPGKVVIAADQLTFQGVVASDEVPAKGVTSIEDLWKTAIRITKPEL
jgi:hypothetical protein